MVGGDLLHMDGSLVDANASRDTALKSDPTMIRHLREAPGIPRSLPTCEVCRRLIYVGDHEVWLGFL